MKELQVSAKQQANLWKNASKYWLIGWSILILKFDKNLKYKKYFLILMKLNCDNQIRANNHIRAREVRVINGDGTMLGILSIQEALILARNRGVDLVEISSHATPPVCKLVDIGKFRYDAAKREKEAKKKQHTTKIKEIQLRPFISERDLQVKIDRAIGFFCNNMKVRLVLRFRGRELRFKDLGFEVVRNFIIRIAPFANAYDEPKFLGRSIIVMLTPLPRSRRAKNPKEEVDII